MVFQEKKLFLLLLYAEPFLNYLELETSLRAPGWQPAPTFKEGQAPKADPNPS